MFYYILTNVILDLHNSFTTKMYFALTTKVTLSNENRLKSPFYLFGGGKKITNFEMLSRLVRSATKPLDQEYFLVKWYSYYCLGV